jgi:DNA-directed RNA polymerase specialized sigma24 family protein
MENTPDLFSEILKKRDSRYRLWVSKADFQLKFKTGSSIVKHMTGEDIVMDIISGVLCGRINWDQERIPNLGTFMHHQIRSHVSNLVKKEQGHLCPYRSLSHTSSSYPKYIDADLIESESLSEILKEQDLNEIREIILKELKDDIIAYFVYEEIAGGSKNSDAAAMLGIPVSEVVNAKKRIMKVIKEFQISDSRFQISDFRFKNK